MPDLNECRITWLKPGFKDKGRLRVQHLCSGYEVQRETGIRDDWGLDELLAQIDALLEQNPLHAKYRR